jgi:hypothetical protein
MAAVINPAMPPTPYTIQGSYSMSQEEYRPTQYYAHGQLTGSSVSIMVNRRPAQVTACSGRVPGETDSSSQRPVESPCTWTGQHGTRRATSTRARPAVPEFEPSTERTVSERGPSSCAYANALCAEFRRHWASAAASEAAGSEFGGKSSQ